MLIAAFAGLLSLSAHTTPAAPAKAIAQPTPEQEVYRLEDLPVIGRDREELIRTFVENVADPVPGRYLSRWTDPVCVGVVNLDVRVAQDVADRISDIAEEMGLKVANQGCKPNINIIATNNPRQLATEFVARRKRDLMPNISGASQKRRALETFQTSDAAIRWWYLNEIRTETGMRAGRVMGDAVSDRGFAGEPIFIESLASRLWRAESDEFVQAYVIIDPTKLTHLNSLQLADYLAVVTLAQISPEADTSTYDSILNVIADADAAPSMTNWDRAYLTGLYSQVRTLSSLRASTTEVRLAIARAADRLSDQED
jgi:hypothetical protein